MARLFEASKAQGSAFEGLLSVSKLLCSLKYMAKLGRTTTRTHVWDCQASLTSGLGLIVQTETEFKGSRFKKKDMPSSGCRKVKLQIVNL